MWRTSSPSAASRSPTSPFGSGVVRSVTPTRDGSDSGAAGWATRGHLDELRSYAAARQTVMPSAVHCTDQYANNRAEVSHQSTAARAVDAHFKSPAHLQRFASVHSVVHNLFWVGRHLLRLAHHRLLRSGAFVEWEAVTSAR